MKRPVLHDRARVDDDIRQREGGDAIGPHKPRDHGLVSASTTWALVTVGHQNFSM